MKQHAANMQLQGIFLDQLFFERNRDFSEDLNNLNLSFNFGHNSEYLQDSNQIITTVVIELKKNNENDKLPFHFKVSMVGNFLINNVDDQHLELLKSVNCPAIILPFVRETIATLITRAGYPPLYIPVINFAGKPQCNEVDHKGKKEKD